MKKFITLLIFKLMSVTKSGQECYYDGNDFCVSQDDIMAADLLPGSILLLDPPLKEEIAVDSENVTIDGSMDSALDEMDFHRKKMNEYLCHGFVAEEIFLEMRSTRVKRRPNTRESYVNSLSDFLGETDSENEVNDENASNDPNDDFNVTIQNKLLSDEGSSKYKNWLHRTTTLDDIYRHYSPVRKIRKKISHRHPLRGSASFHNHNIEDFDGEVTGYALPAAFAPDKTDDEEHLIPSSTGHSYHYSGPEHYSPHSHHHDIVPVIHEEHYYAQPHSHHDEEEYWHRPSYHEKEKSHELTIKDFFEIALTALAFLAFGLFVIQLLMNMTNPQMMMTMAPAVSTMRTIIAEARLRMKRDPQSAGRIYDGTHQELNELSHRVLRSIEAALVAKRDSGRCLSYTLCDDNRYSASIDGSRKIWIPVWSLGMSWLSGRILNKRTWPTMLESIKASVLGLGGVDCSMIYAKCDLARERVKRRRRRRK